MAMTIGTSTSTYQMLAAIDQLNQQQSTTMTRLATNQRITKASDDPSGLVALNAMNGQLAAVNAALDNNNRSTSMLNVADSTLTQVSTLVNGIQDLVLKSQSSSTTAGEKAAYQAQIDQSLSSIDSLINQAQFNGKKLFNGENRINAYTSDTTAVKDIQVYSRDPNPTGNVSLTVDVKQAATLASAATTIAVDNGTTLNKATVVQVTGKLGTATITLASSTAGNNVLAAINAQKEVTGVSAYKDGSNNMHFTSTKTGSDNFVAVSTLSGDASYLTGAQLKKAAGTDAQVQVNGADANAQGTEVFYSGNGVSMSLNLADDTVGTHTITVSGGGAEFQLGADSTTKTALGMGGLNTNELGRSDLGYLASLRSGGANSLTTTDTKALDIVKKASDQVALADARIGSFTKYQLGASTAALQATQQGVSAAADQIGKADYAAESANLSRQQILMNAAVSMLGLANSQQQNVLALLK